MRRPPVAGFLIGLFCSILWFISWFIPWQYDDLWDTWLMHFIVWISTPVAHIVPAIMGWTLRQEAGLFIYSFFAIPITLPLFGLLIGILFKVIKNLIGKSRSEVH
jgi:hypothetical protein